MDKIFFKEVGAYFKLKREENGYTLIEVAEYLGCTAQYICNIEKGRSLASWTKIVKLLKMYGIKHNDFIQLLTIKQQALWKREMTKAASI